MAMFIPDICYYHGNCPDGLLAAYPIWKLFKSETVKLVPYAFSEARLRSLDLIPLTHGQYYDYSECRGMNVLFVDYCPDEISIAHISTIAKAVYIIDHHASAITILDKLLIGSTNVLTNLDMTHSGCYLSFQYYLPELKDHWLVRSVEDRDLFKTPSSYPFAEEIYRVFAVKYMDFENIDRLLNENNQQKYVTEGAAMMDYDISRSNEAIRFAKLYTFDNKYKVYVTNCDFHVVSITGSQLAAREECDFVIMFFYKPHFDSWYLSCRSRKEVNLSIICSEYYGGGGHPQAAGMNIYGPNARLGDTKDKKVMRGTLLDWLVPL